MTSLGSCRDSGAWLQIERGSEVVIWPLEWLDHCQLFWYNALTHDPTRQSTLLCQISRPWLFSALTDFWDSSIRIPLWSELDKGGMVSQVFNSEGSDTNTRSIVDSEPLWWTCVGPVTDWLRQYNVVIVHKLEYMGWHGLSKLTLKSPKSIKLLRLQTLIESK